MRTPILIAVLLLLSLLLLPPAVAANWMGPPGSAPGQSGMPSFDHWGWWWGHSRFAHYHRITRARRGPGFAATSAPVALKALRMIVDGDEAPAEVRAAALIALGKGARPEDEGRLRSAASNAEAPRSVREAAIVGLGVSRRSSKRSVVLLIRTLRDQDQHSRLRGFACLALGLTKAPAGAEALVEVVEGKETFPEVRIAAILGLGLAGQAPREWLAEGRAGDRKLTVLERAWTADAIGRAGDADGIETLLSAATDRSPAVRRSALLALGRLPVDPARLVKILAAEKDRTARGFGLLALARLGWEGEFSAEVEEALREALGAANPVDRGYAALALGRLASSGDPDLRERCGKLLLKRAKLYSPPPGGDPSAVVGLGLMGLLESTDYADHIWYLHQAPRPREFRNAATVATGLLGQAPIMELEPPPVTVSIDAILASGLASSTRTGKNLVAILFLSCADATVRTAVAKSIGYLGDPDWVHPPSGLLGNRECDPQIRAAAAKALGEILDGSALSVLGEIAEDLNHRALVATIEAFLDQL